MCWYFFALHGAIKCSWTINNINGWNQTASDLQLHVIGCAAWEREGLNERNDGHKARQQLAWRDEQIYEIELVNKFLLFCFCNFKTIDTWNRQNWIFVQFLLLLLFMRFINSSERKHKKKTISINAALMLCTRLCVIYCHIFGKLKRIN